VQFWAIEACTFQLTEKNRQETRADSTQNRAMPQLFFSVYSSPTTFTTSLRVARLQSSKHTGAKRDFDAK